MHIIATSSFLDTAYQTNTICSRMAAGPSNEGEYRGVADDFGIKELLSNSFEDDDTFWTNFCDYQAEARAELAINPLTFPIPPTVQLNFNSAIQTPSPLDQPNSYPTRPLTQQTTVEVNHTLAELQNSPSTLKDEDVKNFIDEKNKYKTQNRVI